MVSEPKFLSSEMVDEARFSELCQKVTALADNHEDNKRKIEALAKNVDELNEVVAELLARFPAPASPTHAIESGISSNSPRKVVLEPEPPDLVGSGILMNDDDLLADERLKFDDAIISGEELVQFEKVDESNLGKKATDSGAHQVFDEMSGTFDNPEMKMKGQIATVVDDLLLLMASDKGKLSMKALKASDLNDAKAILVVKSELTDLIIVLTEFPTQGRVMMDHMRVMSFDPGGVNVACAHCATSVLSGICADFCCHFGTGSEPGQAKAKLMFQRLFLGSKLVIIDYYAECFACSTSRTMRVAQDKAESVMFDPGGKCSAPIDILNSNFKATFNPLLVKPIKSNEHWVVLLGINSEPLMIFLMGICSILYAENGTLGICSAGTFAAAAILHCMAFTFNPGGGPLSLSRCCNSQVIAVDFSHSIAMFGHKTETFQEEKLTTVMEHTMNLQHTKFAPSLVEFPTIDNLLPYLNASAWFLDFKKMRFIRSSTHYCVGILIFDPGGEWFVQTKVVSGSRGFVFDPGGKCSRNKSKRYMGLLDNYFTGACFCLATTNWLPTHAISLYQELC